MWKPATCWPPLLTAVAVPPAGCRADTRGRRAPHQPPLGIAQLWAAHSRSSAAGQAGRRRAAATAAMWRRLFHACCLPGVTGGLGGWVGGELRSWADAPLVLQHTSSLCPSQQMTTLCLPCLLLQGRLGRRRPGALPPLPCGGRAVSGPARPGGGAAPPDAGQGRLPADTARCALPATRGALRACWHCNGCAGVPCLVGIGRGAAAYNNAASPACCIGCSPCALPHLLTPPPPAPPTLHPQLQRLVAGAPTGPAAVQLLDELMAVAMERCTEPLLVDSSVLDRVLAAAKQAGGGGGQPSMSLL